MTNDKANDKAITTIINNAIEYALPDILEMTLTSKLGTTDINSRNLDSAFFSFYELSENATDEYIERCIKLIHVLKSHGYMMPERMLSYTFERVTNKGIFDAIYACFNDYYMRHEKHEQSPVLSAFNADNIAIAEYLISKGHEFFTDTLNPQDVLVYAPSDTIAFYLNHSNKDPITITAPIIKAIAENTDTKVHNALPQSCVGSILGSPELIYQACLCSNVNLLNFAHSQGFNIAHDINPALKDKFVRINYLPLSQSEYVFTTCLRIDPAFSGNLLIQSSCLMLALSKNYTSATEYILDAIERDFECHTKINATTPLFNALTGINESTPEYILKRLEVIIGTLNCTQDEANKALGYSLSFMVRRYELTDHFDLFIIKQSHRFGVSLDEGNENECVSLNLIRDMVDSRQIGTKSEDKHFDKLVTVLNTLNVSGTADTFNEVCNYELIKGRSLKQLLNFLKGKNSQKKVLTKLLIAICNTEQKSKLLNLVTPINDGELTEEFNTMLSMWSLTPYDILESKELNISRKARAEITKALVF